MESDRRAGSPTQPRGTRERGIRVSELKKDHTRFRRFEDHFVSDIQGGELPDYADSVPRFMGSGVVAANSEHEPLDVRYGKHLLATIYNALRANEELLSRTLFVVTLDYHEAKQKSSSRWEIIRDRNSAPRY